MTLLKRISSKENGIKNAKDAIGYLVRYFLLIGIGFVYLYPVIYMVVISLMPNSDLINPTIEWVPSYLDFSAYKTAFEVMDYLKTFLFTFLFALVAASIQTAICSVVGFAFARYQIYGKKLWIVLLLIAFIIPVDVVAVPRYILYNQYNLIGSLQSMFLPALLGQGIKSSMFIFLFMQGFSSYPKAYDEAAQLDGANEVQVFAKVAIPLAVSIIVLSFLFSFIWYWNETSQTELFLSGAYTTLPMQLSRFDSLFSEVASAVSSGNNRLNEHMQMTATLMTIAPLVLLYFFSQKGMISSVESAGITGE